MATPFRWKVPRACTSLRGRGANRTRRAKSARSWPPRPTGYKRHTIDAVVFYGPITGSYALILDSYTPPLERRLHDCITNHRIAIAVLEGSTIRRYLLVVNDRVEEMGDLVDEGVLPANDVTVRPPVRPERVICFGHQDIGEALRFFYWSIFPEHLK